MNTEEQNCIVIRFIGAFFFYHFFLCLKFVYEMSISIQDILRAEQTADRHYYHCFVPYYYGLIWKYIELMLVICIAHPPAKEPLYLQNFPTERSHTIWIIQMRRDRIDDFCFVHSWKNEIKNLNASFSPPKTPSLNETLASSYEMTVVAVGVCDGFIQW